MSQKFPTLLQTIDFNDPQIWLHAGLNPSTATGAAKYLRNDRSGILISQINYHVLNYNLKLLKFKV